MEKDKVESFHKALDMALAELCKRYDLEKIKSHITYSDTDLNISIKLNEKTVLGELKVDMYKEGKLGSLMRCYIPTDLQKDFANLTLMGLRVNIDGVNYQIIDWNPRARSYPIIYKRLSDDKQYKCSGSYMAKYIAEKLRLANERAEEILAKAI